MNVQIVCDSACDVPETLQRRYGVLVIPLDIRVGQHFVTTAELTLDRFWALVAETGERPQTAAPPPGRIIEAVRPVVSGGHRVLALTLTGRLSAVHRSFVLAAESFKGRMVVFDTQNLSLGAGVQVLAAARWAAEGHDLETIHRRLYDLRARVRLQAVLDTLDWAERGGRIAYLMPLIRRTARVFRVKVLLQVVEGEVRLLGVQRSWSGGMEMLYRHTLAWSPLEDVWVVHTRRPDEAAIMAQRLTEALGWPSGRVPVVEAGPILAAHVGPGAIATVAVLATEPRRGGG